MKFIPIQKMMERVENNGDTDYALFHELLLAGELITKVTAAALVASIEDDQENRRYQCLHTLVRTDGIGEWAAIIEKIFHGSVSQCIPVELAEVRNVFTQRVRKGSWQYEAISDLQRVLRTVYPEVDSIANKVSLCTWFKKFSELRNKTRGHGAITHETCARSVPFLHDSIWSLIDHNPILYKSWAYIHRHLSGKYRVVPLGGNSCQFSELTTAATAHKANYADGIYLWVGRPRYVALLYGTPDATDFFCS